MRNKVYFQKTKLLIFMLKHAYLCGWYEDSDKARSQVHELMSNTARDEITKIRGKT